MPQFNSQTNKEIFTKLKDVLNNHKEETIQKRKEITPNFNLIQLISPKELQLSKIIAEFLNPNGSHEQGSLFLDEFLNLFYKRKLPKKNITVKTELSKNVNGQIDIVIDFDNKFGIAIENKPFAEDQNLQIIRYIEYLKTQYSENYLMIYLSSLGQKPTEKSLPKKAYDNHFLILSYKDIGNWLLKCCKETEKNAKRLTQLILEFVEYTNIEFLKTNKLNNRMLGKAIQDNVLEAFEIKELWKNDKAEFDTIWAKKVNDLFNKTLPKLVFEELQRRKIIDNQWEFIEGNFDINSKAVKGFHIKKKEWVHFSYAVLRNQISNIPKGSSWFFPAIQSKSVIEEYNINIPFDFQLKYCEATNTQTQKEQWGRLSPTIWWSDFPNNEFQVWGYQQWSEIKENGKTVTYIADFFEKLIKISLTDIEDLENGLQ